MSIALQRDLDIIKEEYRQLLAKLQANNLFVNSPDISDQGVLEATEAVEAYQAMLNKMQDFIKAGEALAAVGYPAMPAQFASAEVIAEFKQYLAYLGQAVAEYQPPIKVEITATPEAPLDI